MCPSSYSSSQNFQTREFIKKHISQANWLNGLLLRLDGNILQISFIHEYFGQWFLDSKKSEFEAIAKSYLNNPGLDFIYLAPERRQNHFKYKPAKKLYEKPPAGKPDRTGGETVFSSFLANDKNHLALTAARRAACLENKPDAQLIGQDSPLLIICGKSGAGKSHLLNAIYLNLKNIFPHLRLCRSKAALFCAKYGEKANLQQMESFWDRPTALLLDDFQELAGNAAWQNAIIQHIDLALEAQWPDTPCPPYTLIFTCAAGMADKLEKRLQSRLQSGLMVELRLPDLEVRLRYLENAGAGIGLGRDQILFIARNTLIIPQIRGLLRKIRLFAASAGHTPNMAELEELAAGASVRKAPGYQEIIAKVAQKFGLKPDEMLATSRKPERVLARHIAMYLCRQSLGMSYPELGKIFGGKDHSTVMHGIKKIEYLLTTDKDVHKLLTELKPKTD